jgi:uncharacterized membrane protein YfcA
VSVETYAVSLTAAFLISFVSTTGGVTGAFLLVPFQVSVLGLSGPAVSATNHLYNVFAAPGGFSGYWRRNRLFWPVAAVLVAGTVPGIAVGIAVRVRFLLEAGRFRTFAGVVLLVLGVVLLVRSVVRQRRRRDDGEGAGEIDVLRFDARWLRFRFAGATYGARVPPMFLYALLVGIVGGAYGVGGGVFTAAYLIGVCGLPVYVTAGATLLATFVASCAGTLGFALLSWVGIAGGVATAPLWGLGAAMGVGGFLGGHLGARVQRFLPSVAICVGLAILLLGLGVAYVLE